MSYLLLLLHSMFFLSECTWVVFHTLFGIIDSLARDTKTQCRRLPMYTSWLFLKFRPDAEQLIKKDFSNIISQDWTCSRTSVRLIQKFRWHDKTWTPTLSSSTCNHGHTPLTSTGEVCFIKNPSIIWGPMQHELH